MKRILILLIILLVPLQASAEIRWDKVVGGLLFAGLGCWMMNDGFTIVESTADGIIFNYSPGVDVTTGNVINAGNCDLNNFYARYTLVTFKKDPTNSFDIVDKRIPQEYSYGNFYTGRSFNFSFTGYTTTKTPEVERVENWNYEKRYKYKSADMGYAGILLTCISAYIVIDGFGILGEMQKAGADLNISIPQIGMIQTDLTLKFD